MKTAIACGGTGGHVFPGLAVAGELKRRGHDVVLWLSGRNIESSSLAGWDGPVHAVRAEGFSGFGWRSLVAVFRMLASIAACIRQMRSDRPDVLLAMGSYASVGPVMAARWHHVPVVLHEANVIPGRAVSFLSRYAAAVAVSFAGTSENLPGRNCVHTGFPVRRELSGVAGKRPSGGLSILIMGGSQGAHTLNELVSLAVCSVHASGVRVSVIHLTGARDEAAIRVRYNDAGVPNRVHAFLKEMESAYSAADFAICRSGAATCAELLAVGLPALLVPFPQATHNHQFLNAVAAKNQGFADVVEQRDLTVEWLTSYIQGLPKDPDKLAMMRNNAGTVAKGDPSGKVADLLENTAHRRLTGSGFSAFTTQ